MSDAPAQTDGRALAALLAHIHAVCDEERKRIRDEAEREATRILRDARAHARERVRNAIQHVRHEEEQAIREARAKRETRLRERRHRAWRMLLDGLTEELNAAVEACWRSPASRQRWIASSLDKAVSHLPAADWQVEHPRDCDASEIEIGAATVEVAGRKIDCTADPVLHAGIRIRAGEALLDASAETILARSVIIEGLLLGEVERLGRADSEPAGPKDPAG